MAISASSSLSSLYLDFNTIGETAGKMLIVAAAGHRTLTTLDLEACELTEEVGRVSAFLTAVNLFIMALRGKFKQPIGTLTQHCDQRWR